MTTVTTTPSVPSPAARPTTSPSSAELQRLVDAYRTSELATITRDGTPIAWPVMAVRDPESGAFTLTTSIGFPAKAFNIRRDPHVSLLFSEPRGSGLSHAPRVLVQGTATCPDRIVTDPSGMEGYWRTLYTRQPAGAMYGANSLTRKLFDWYYFRLVVAVTPHRISLDDRALPKVKDRRRAPSTDHRGTPFWDAAMAVRRYPSAVLTTVDADGFPRSQRVRPATSRSGAFVLPRSLDVEEGPASLLCHHHDERTWRLRSVVVVGDVRRRVRGAPVFDVRRVVPGASSANPLALLAATRHARRSAAGYLAHRGLDRPTVPWEAYERLH
jgi:general stress protein 26